MDAATLFENTMDWLRDAYGEHRFFVERDIVWTAQLRLLQEVEHANLPYRVFDEHKIRKDARSGADLVIMEGGLVSVAAEFKYEPSHERKAPLQPEPTGNPLTRKKARQRAQDILATKLPRCGWGEIKKDMDKVRAYFHEGRSASVVCDTHRRGRILAPPVSRCSRRQRVAGLGQRRVGVVDEGGRRCCVQGSSGGRIRRCSLACSRSDSRRRPSADGMGYVRRASARSRE